MSFVKGTPSLLILGIILILATGARFYRLGELPGGLYMDEAADANDATASAADHQYQVFYPGDGGREGLWIVMLSASLSAFGKSIFAVRVWSPIVGIATVLVMYGLAKHWFGVRVALISAWLLATSFWHLMFSRVAFRGVLVPLMLVASLYFLQLAWESNRRIRYGFATLGGLFFGLGFYSYIPFRIAPLLALAVLGVELKSRSCGKPQETLRTFGLWTAIAILVILPLIGHFLRHPNDLTQRTAEVSLASSPHPVRMLVQNSLRTAWMFFGKGDANWRHNLRPMPQLIYPVGLFFAIGIVLTFSKRPDSGRRLRAFVLIAWLAIMLLPSVLSNEGVPHSLRSIGALPAAIMIAAIGADWFLEKTAERKTLAVLAIGIIVVAGVTDVARYFLIWGPSPQVVHAYQEPQTEMAGYLNDLPPATEVLIFVDVPTDYGWHAHAYPHQNPDGMSELLPLQAQIPLFLVSHKSHIAYFPTDTAARTSLAQSYQCPVLAKPKLLPRDTLLLASRCNGLVVGRLSSRG